MCIYSGNNSTGENALSTLRDRNALHGYLVVPPHSHTPHGAHNICRVWLNAFNPIATFNKLQYPVTFIIWKAKIQQCARAPQLKLWSDYIVLMRARRILNIPFIIILWKPIIDFRNKYINNKIWQRISVTRITTWIWRANRISRASIDAPNSKIRMLVHCVRNCRKYDVAQIFPFINHMPHGCSRIMFDFFSVRLLCPRLLDFKLPIFSSTPSSGFIANLLLPFVLVAV